MGNVITLIKKISLTSYSVTVSVCVDRQYTLASDLKCAAFVKDGSVDYSSINWKPQYATHFVSIPKLDIQAINDMDTMMYDALGNMIQADTRYKIKCHVRYWYNGNQKNAYEHCTFRTHPVPGCVSGVAIAVNGNNPENLPVHGPLTSYAQVLDFNDVDYSSFHKDIHGLFAYEFPHPTPRDMDIVLTCCEGTECVFWLSLYRCIECTGEKPDGLATELLLRGWDSGSCSPRFDDTFETTAFHKKIDATDGTETVIIPSKYREIIIMFGIDGHCPEDWCIKPTGAFPTGQNCDDVGCPSDCAP